jgi:phasin family protein
MYDQINSQFITASKNFADAMFKAHSVAIEGFERITELNLKTLENRMSATSEFLSEATEVRDFEGFKTLWPKSVNLVKESSEKLYSNTQEVVGIALKTNEALGQMAKGGFEAANDNFSKQVNAQVNAVKKTVAAAK